MVRIRLRISSPICAGVVSVGTIQHVMVLRRLLKLNLGEAKEYVDRCVFAGECVEIAVESHEVADAVVQELKTLPGPVVIEAYIEE